MQEAIQQARRDLVEFGLEITVRPYVKFDSIYDNYLQRVLASKNRVLNAIIVCDNLVPMPNQHNGLRDLCYHTLNVLSESLNYKNHYGTGNLYGIPLDYKDATNNVTFPNNNTNIHAAGGVLPAGAIQGNQNPVTIGELILDAHRAAMMSMAVVFRFWLQCIICLVYDDIDILEEEQNEAMRNYMAPYFDIRANDTVLACLRNVSSLDYHVPNTFNPYTLINPATVNPLPANFQLARYYPILWRNASFCAAFPFRNIGNVNPNPRTTNTLIDMLKASQFGEFTMIYDDTNYRQEIYNVSKGAFEFAGRPESVDSGVQVLQNNNNGYDIKNQEEIQILRQPKTWEQRHIFQLFDTCMQRHTIQEMLIALGGINTIVNPGAGNAGGATAARVQFLINVFTRLDNHVAARAAVPALPADPVVVSNSCLQPVTQDLLTWDTAMAALNVAHTGPIWQIPTNGVVFRSTDDAGRATRHALPLDAVWVNMDVWKANTHWLVYNTQRHVGYLNTISKFITVLANAIDWPQRRVPLRTLKEYVEKAKPPKRFFLHPESWALHQNNPPVGPWQLVQKRMRYAGQLIQLPPAPPAAAAPAGPPLFNRYHRQ